MVELHTGLYDQLVTLALQRRLENPEFESRSVPLSPDTAAEALARHVFRFAAAVLDSVTGKDSEKIVKQIELTNGLLDWLATVDDKVDPDDQVTARRLMQVLRRDQVRLGAGELPRPSIPLRHSDLIVNGPKDLRMGREIQREIASADSVDVLVSFVKWTGGLVFMHIQQVARHHLTLYRRRHQRLELAQAVARQGAGYVDPQLLVLR